PTGRIPDAAPDPAREPAPDHAPERAAHRIYMHLGWWTLGRLPLMPVDLQWLVEAQIIALSRRLDAEPVAVRAASDRVRLLLRIKPGHSLASLVPRLKHGSQDALTRAGRGVHWASGFAAASVSADAVRDVVRRIGDLD
ncbi:MAG: hypothetical protein ACR2GQ_03480, partial [Gemmatimonadota bacterium]